MGKQPKRPFRRHFFYRTYNTDYDSLIVNCEARNTVICSLARLAVKRGYYVFVLVDRIQHLRNLTLRLRDVAHRVVYGGRKVEKRMDDKDLFEEGKVRLILANRVFTKGVDVKRLDVIIDGSGKKSKNEALQKFGRGVRQHQEKSGLLYFDISDRGQDNPFEKASKSRARAFKLAGVPSKKFVWGSQGESAEALAYGERFLKEILQ